MADNKELNKQLESLASEIKKRSEGLYDETLRGVDYVKNEKEHLHDIIGEKIYGKYPPRYSRDAERHQDLPATHAGEPRLYDTAELYSKVKKLIEYVFEHSLESAIEQVKKTNDEALIDAFHDALVDELHDHLVNTGKLKKI